MSALSGFRGSDTLHVDSLTFAVEGSPRTVRLGATRAGGLTKAPGEMGVVLCARDHLGLDPGAALPLRLVPDGPSSALPGGHERQGYLVDESPGVAVRHAGGEMHVDRIHGRIVLEFAERIPWSETRNPAGEIRYLRADVVSDPDASELDIEGSSGGVRMTVRMTSLALAARAASAGFDVVIHVSRNECGVVGVVPGGMQRFVATVGSVPPGARKYAWSVRGGRIVGHATLPHLEVALSPEPAADPTPVHVELRVEVAGLAVTVATAFKPDTPVQRRAKELACEIQHHAFHNMRQAPSGSGREASARPFTRAELLELRDAAAALVQEIEAALRLDE